MQDDLLQRCIRWNLERRNAARTGKDTQGVNHFQRNLDALRARVVQRYARHSSQRAR